jgi:hypothetical protein
MVTFASETKYNDYQIIGCIAPGVKLAEILVRRYIGTSEVIVALSNRRWETDTVSCGETMAADRLVVVLKQL